MKEALILGKAKTTALDRSKESKQILKVLGQG